VTTLGRLRHVPEYHPRQLHLSDRDGLVKSIVPPILSAERLAELMIKHL
jgi:hypothetical protein